MKNYELRITNYELLAAKILCALCFFGGLIVSANAQSINQSFPTPIISNEIGGRIPARDLGDARLTSYFYTFEGKQGDVFINVVTTNLNGDIDVFTADNLHPLTKITVYADAPNNETGRVIYLRQPVKLILRVEGRTPNDDAATFQIKFAGSFAPSTAIAETDAAPEVKSNNQTDVRVNSVGTIIEVKPKPTPTPKEIIAKVEKKPKEKKSKIAVAENKPETEKSAVETVAEKTGVKETVAETQAEKQPDKQAEEEVAAEIEAKSEKDKQNIERAEIEAKKEAEVNENQPSLIVVVEEPIKKDAEIKDKAEIEKKVEKAETAKGKKKSNAVKPLPPSALENINLIILFKDGSKIERPMSGVLKVGVDKGILTVISTDGSIGRYSILDVEKMTIQ